MTILCVRFQLPPKYEAALPGLLGLIEDFTPVVEALPPDGALADLRGAERYFGRDAEELARLIRVRALALYGVDCLIGAGPGPLTARLALGAAAPGSPCAVPEELVVDFLAELPVGALPGVGTATARTLCEYGLDTLGGVACAPLSTLQRLVGARIGRELHEKANGVDRGRVVPNAVAHSLAAEHPFSRDELNPDRHRRALLMRHRRTGLPAARPGQGLPHPDPHRPLRRPFFDDPHPHAQGADRPLPGADRGGLRHVRRPRSPAGPRPRDRPARRGPHPADQASHQLAFDPVDEKVRRIEEVADRARAKFGPHAVMPGTLAA